MTVLLPSEYEDTARERKVIPFVGAGFSKNISADMPNWREVMDIVAKALGYDPDVLGLHGDYLQIAQYLKIRGKEGAVYSDLQNLFHLPTMSVSTSRPHRLLPYIDAPAIFTTNWDYWIERSFEHEGVPYVKIVSPRDFYDREVVAPGAPLTATPLYDTSRRARILREHPATSIVKFHGDFTDHQSVVFAEDKYFDRMAFEDPLDLFLRSEILGRSVLFVGYSFTDRNIRFIWHRLRRMMASVPDRAKRPSYLITSGASNVQQEVMQQLGIHLIQVSPGAVGDGISEVLERTIEWQEA
ncbi:MAG TPA: SIR2 family protein [Actinophytocola sp.]|uniref:SIR2 family protein n=1 Tax=Actinophytocola sp. TaxID=1872138 RepID=UPI002DDCEBCA|nr:SIR2 family protein [Actinophytocola sp.]HEV2778885.1 SIR2 family protein [Actinophytocola sp.]